MYRKHAAFGLYGREAAVYVQAARLKTVAPFLNRMVLNSRAARATRSGGISYELKELP
jgi:hypothetical protein